MSDRGTPKFTILVKFGATDLYPNEIQNFIVELLCVSKSKLELPTFFL